MEKQKQADENRRKQKKRIITALIMLIVAIVIPFMAFNIFGIVFRTNKGLIIISTAVVMMCSETVSMITFIVNMILYFACLTQKQDSVEINLTMDGCENCRYASVYTESETEKTVCSMGHDTEGRNSCNCEDFCAKNYVSGSKKGVSDIETIK